MPTATDLVTDLPADFEVFGQAVDTQMKTNADAATLKATLTTKGDIYAATAASTPARLAVGANDTVLTADSTTATGLKWATPAGAKNFSLLNTGGTALTGADTITISGISSMDQLMIVVQGASITSTSGVTDIGFRFNADTGSNYRNSFINYQTAFDSFGVNGSSVTLGSVNTGADELSGYLFLSGGATSGIKVFNAAGGGDTSGSNRWRWFGGAWTGSAITSVSIINLTGGGSPNFDSGTIYVYGAA